MTWTESTILASASGTGDSADRWGCPAVHELPGIPDRHFVISRDDLTDDEHAALAGHVGHDAQGLLEWWARHPEFHRREGSALQCHQTSPSPTGTASPS